MNESSKPPAPNGASQHAASRPHSALDERPPSDEPVVKASHSEGRRRRSRQRRSRVQRTVSATLAWLDIHDSRLIISLCGLVVMGSLLAVGTVHVTTIALFAPTAVLTGALAGWREGWKLKDLAPGVWILGLLALFTGFQSLPLPASWVLWVAPHNADIWMRALYAFGEPGPAWVSLSLDPGASLLEALKWLSYGAIVVAGASVGKRFGARSAAALVFSSAAIAALITLAHAVTHATKLYGFYVPLFPTVTWGLSPLLNANNFAGYLNLGVFAGIGVLVSHKTPGPRWLIAIAIAIALAVGFLEASRGGALSCLVGLLVLVPALRTTRRRERHRIEGKTESLVEVVAMVLGAASLFFLAADGDVWRSLLQEGATKLAVVGWTRPMIADHPWFGVGRGAYETVFPAYDLARSHVMFQFAENFPAQWISEWGIPVGLGGLLSLGWSFRPSRLRAYRDPVAAATVVGILVLLLQNLVDLSLEITSVSLSVFFLLGALWGCARDREEKSKSSPEGVSQGRRHRSRAVPETGHQLRGSKGFALAHPESVAPAPPKPVTARLSIWAVALAATGTLLIPAVLLASRPSALYERERLYTEYRLLASQGATEVPQFLEQVRSAVMRHPGDPHLYILGAGAALREGKNPLKWVSLALERDRGSGRPYLILAEALVRTHAKAQALEALRSALEREPAMGPLALRIALRVTRNPDELLVICPPGEEGAQVLGQAAILLQGADQEWPRQRLRELAIERAPQFLPPRLSDADEILVALGPRSRSGRCTGERRRGCLERLAEHARVANQVAPQEAQGLILQARTLIVEGNPRSAQRMLNQKCVHLKDPLPCFRTLIEAASLSQDKEELDSASQDLVTRACLVPQRCAPTASWVGTIYASRQEWPLAASYFERAALESGSIGAWLQVASAAAKGGDLPRSKRAFDRAKLAGLKPNRQSSPEAERTELLNRLGPR